MSENRQPTSMDTVADALLRVIGRYGFGVRKSSAPKSDNWNGIVIYFPCDALHPAEETVRATVSLSDDELRGDWPSLLLARADQAICDMHAEMHKWAVIGREKSQQQFMHFGGSEHEVPNRVSNERLPQLQREGRLATNDEVEAMAHELIRWRRRKTVLLVNEPPSDHGRAKEQIAQKHVELEGLKADPNNWFMSALRDLPTEEETKEIMRLIGRFDELPQSETCTCPIDVLMTSGCKCGKK